MRFMASLVLALREKPRTVTQMTAHFGVISNAVMRRNLRVLLDLRVIRIAGWERVGSRASPVRLYGVGDEPGVQPPVMTARGARSRHRGLPTDRCQPKAEAIAFASVWNTLREPTAPQELADATGLGLTTLRPLLRFMHEFRLIGVAEWERGLRGPPTPYYRLGVLRPAPRPKPLPAAELQRRQADTRRIRTLQSRLTFASNQPHFAQEA